MSQQTETAPISPKQGQYLSVFILILGVGMLALTYLWIRPMTIHVMTSNLSLWVVGIILISGGYILGAAAVLAGTGFFLSIRRNWIEL